MVECYGVVGVVCEVDDGFVVEFVLVLVECVGVDVEVVFELE